MKKMITITLCLLMSVLSMQAQTETYSFLEWAPEKGEAEYTSTLEGEATEVSSQATGCFVELATFAGHSLNKRFAFASAENVTLTANGGLVVKNNAGKKNTTIAILGLQEGDKVTIEYNSGNEVQLTSGNAYYEQADGTTVSFTKVGKNNANKLAKNTVGTNGGTEYTFTMTKSGSLDLLSASTAGSISFYSVIVNHPSGRRAAFVFNSTYPGYDAETTHMLPNFIKDNYDVFAETEIVDIDLAQTTVSTANLLSYALVILSSAIAADEPQAEVLRQTIGYVPMLNMSANLYATWGYGNKAQAGTNIVTVSNKSHELFTSRESSIAIDEESYLQLLGEGGDIEGYTATGEYFAADQVLATAGDVNVIHVHNAARNAYLLLPFTLESMDYLPDFAADMVANAVNLLKKSTRTIVKTAAPEYQLTYADGKTSVTLACPTTGVLNWIYFTTDGTEPTEQSQRYTEPIVIAEEDVVVKAIARADGYELSDVLTTDVIDLRKQVEAPAISIAQQVSGQTVVEMACTTPGATIYYNYTGSNLPIESSVYTSPITLTKHATVTAIATVEGMVNSEATSLYVSITDELVRIDTLAWMNAHDEAYGHGDWVKEYSFWSTEKADSVGTPMTYADGAPMLDENNEPMIEWTYTYAPADSLTYKDFGNGWAIGSYGQRINNQSKLFGTHVGTGETGPLTANDAGYSVGAMSLLATKTNNDPSSAWIQTTKRYQGPFDITLWITGQRAAGLDNSVELSISKDSIDWTPIDVVSTTELQNVVKFTRSYEGDDEVYLKARSVVTEKTQQQKILIFDILLLGHGQLSQAFENNATGISEATLQNSHARIVSKKYYNVNGVETGRLVRGINIVRETYEDGMQKTRKMIVK